MRVAGVDVPPAPAPAPIWWAHHDACAWVAAWLTVRGRGLVGPRELIADESWQGELKASPGPGGWSTRPDLVGIVPGRRPAAIEVELARKSKARLRAILGLHARWIASGKTGACVYVCGNADVHKLVSRRPSTSDSAGPTEACASSCSTRSRNWFAKRARPFHVERDSPKERRDPGQPAHRHQRHPGARRLGALCAWTMRRYSTLSVRNLYPPAAITAALLGAVLAMHAWRPAMVLAPRPRSSSARRFAAGGFGSRTSEPARSSAPSSKLAAGSGSRAPARREGERVYLRSQGELVHQRPWPTEVPYAPMSSVDHGSLRLPLGAGQHIFACGATGSGKTTTMRRVLAARTITQQRGAADPRPEGRRGGRRADEPTRRGRRRAVRSDRPA